jgi:hypothetical protein
LGYEVVPANTAGYRRIHAPHNPHTADPYLHVCYPPGSEHIAPNIVGMNDKYHTLHKIFRNVLAVKQGDKGKVRNWLINTLYYACHPKKFDIMDNLYNEMRLVVCEKKCAIYGPYL